MKKNLDVYSLILANLVTIIAAVVYRWDAEGVMFTYWCQSVIIGMFTYLKLRNLPLDSYKKDIKDGSTLTINGRDITDPAELKQKKPNFFLVHYGSFHIAYLIFILKTIDNPQILVGAAVPVFVFALNHYYSYRKNKDCDIVAAAENPGAIFIKPYFRILPMHLVIILGQGSTGTRELVLFMLIKTIMDIILHIMEHKTKNESQGNTGANI